MSAGPENSFVGAVCLIFLAVILACCLLFSQTALSAQECNNDLISVLEFDFVDDIQPILDAHCVTCHQPGGEGYDATLLDLRPGFSWSHLVNVPSRQDPDKLLVWPRFFLSDSLLFTKINCESPTVGSRMPLGSEPLTSEEQSLLFFWIFNDALPSTAPVGMPINPGFSGSWFNPATAGQGFSVEVIAPDEDEAGLMLMYWFTFAQDPEQGARWYFADGSFEQGQSVVELTIYQNLSGRFDAAEPAAELVPVGQAEIRLMSCRRARLEYLLNEDDDPERQLWGTIMLERLSPPDSRCLEVEDAFADDQ